jgi:hypothetical protein
VDAETVMTPGFEATGRSPILTLCNDSSATLDDRTDAVSIKLGISGENRRLSKKLVHLLKMRRLLAAAFQKMTYVIRTSGIDQ